MATPNELLVFVELLEGAPTDLSLQVLGRARELAGATGATVAAFVGGSGLDAVPAALVAARRGHRPRGGRPGSGRLRHGPLRPRPEGGRGGALPRAVLLPASTTGSDLAPRVAGGAGEPLPRRRRRARAGGGDVPGAPPRARPEGDDLVSRGTFRRRLLFVTLRDGASRAAPGRPGAVRARPSRCAVPPAVRSGARVVRRDVARKTVNLKDAKVIVAGGAGVGSREGWKLVEDLAAALGGEVAATRAVVDAGWASAERQVGQTGVTVRPDLYLACGISGAVQHRVGMMDSKTIVAVNTDGAAPIFRCAHYRLVGDLKVVLPKLLSLLAGGLAVGENFYLDNPDLQVPPREEDRLGRRSSP